MLKILTPEFAKLVNGSGSGGGTEPGTEKPKIKTESAPPVYPLSKKTKG
jgi:hypothetical protein